MGMKYFFIMTFISAWLLCSCKQNNPDWKIEFCTELKNEICVTTDTVFPRNTRVYVTLKSQQEIKDSIIVGNIYRMLNGTYDDYLGTNHFEVPPNTHELSHYIPFDQLGGAGPHLIEFTKEDGTLILTKELFIE